MSEITSNMSSPQKDIQSIYLAGPNHNNFPPPFEMHISTRLCLHLHRSAENDKVVKAHIY